MSDSASLEFVGFLKRQIQHVRTVSRSKTSDSTRPEFVVLKNVRFSISRMGCGHKVSFRIVRMSHDQKRHIH
jgi:hypothetical protein